MNLTINNQTMSSREIAELTGKQVKHIHRDFKLMANELGFPCNAGLMPSPNMDLGFSYEKDSQNRISAINMNQDLTLTLVSGYSVKLRSAIIKRWRELEDSTLKPKLPTNYLEALQHLVEKETLLLEQAPKVEFHDKIVQTNNTYKYQEAGKKIQQRPNKFVKWLREEKYIDKLNIPYQRYIDQKLFKMNSGVSDFGHAYSQGRITSKGLAYFTNKLVDTKL